MCISLISTQIDYLHMLIGHLYIYNVCMYVLSWEMSAQMFCTFKSGVVFYCVIKVLYIFWVPVLYQIPVLQIFYPNLQLALLLNSVS